MMDLNGLLFQQKSFTASTSDIQTQTVAQERGGLYSNPDVELLRLKKVTAENICSVKIN